MITTYDKISYFGFDFDFDWKSTYSLLKTLTTSQNKTAWFCFWTSPAANMKTKEIHSAISKNK